MMLEQNDDWILGDYTNRDTTGEKEAEIHDYKTAAFGIIGGLLSGTLGNWMVEAIKNVLAPCS